MSGKPWSESDLTTLREMYPSRPSIEIAKALGCRITRVYAKAADLRLKKSQAFLDSPESYRLRGGNTVGAAMRFKKGQVPANKGLKRPGWGPGRMKETQFQKGCRSGQAAENWKPVGTILPDPDGYLRIKIREAVHGKEATGYGNTKVWPMLSRHVWEQHKGPIPPKHLVKFIDGDRQNCAIENLELISIADNMRRNSIWATMPRELAEVIQLQGALKGKLRRIDGQEQNV